MNTKPSLVEIADRADEIFETRIGPLIKSQNPDDFLAIDINSGDYETGPKDLPTERRLRLRHPDGLIYVRRVGDQAAYYVG